MNLFSFDKFRIQALGNLLILNFIIINTNAPTPPNGYTLLDLLDQRNL
jgi:hypothetical protein